MKNIEIKNIGPADLRASEPWRIAIQAAREGELLFIPRKVWEGLDPSNRAAIDAQAKAAKVVVLTQSGFRGVD